MTQVIFQAKLNSYADKFREQKNGAKVLLKEVPDPQRFGVAQIADNKVIAIEEKPKKPKSNYCVTGLYFYDNRVVDFAKNLAPSARGEYEIVDLNNNYLNRGELVAEEIKGEWIDAGTFESLHRASVIAREHKLGITGVKPKKALLREIGISH